MTFNHRPIIIFDLDETVIGNIRPQLYEYFIIKNIKKNVQSSKYVNCLISDLNRGLLRPYFKDLIDYLAKNNVDIFMYTASTPEWAEFIIPVIEKCIKQKCKLAVWPLAKL
jgi:predicted secreted acid phosphatase